MADRRVRQTGKDDEGDITQLCNDTAAWSPRRRDDAIRDIETSAHTYYVEEAGYRSEISVATRSGRKYLRTYADATSKNNLDNLPDC